MIKRLLEMAIQSFPPVDPLLAIWMQPKMKDGVSCHCETFSRP